MRRIALAGGLLAILACSPRSRTPDPDAVVAEIGSHRITVARIQEHLRANLLDAESVGEEGPPPPELDRARSRLFDQLIDEELIYLEAEKRGFEAGPDELDAYLAEATADADSPPGSPRPQDTEAVRRAVARRAILIDKFRQAWLRNAAKVDETEVDGRVAEAKERLEASWTPAARVVGFHDEEQATRERDALLRSQSALAKRFDDPATLPDPEDLPEEARTALESLGAGGVSGPFAVGAGFVLVVKQPRPTGAAWTAWIRSRAREELRGEVSARETTRLIAGLRARTKVKLHPEELPFHYE